MPVTDKPFFFSLPFVNKMHGTEKFWCNDMAIYQISFQLFHTQFFVVPTSIQTTVMVKTLQQTASSTAHAMYKLHE
jgi:hypothetical protein